MRKIKLNPVSKRLPGNLGRLQMLLKEVLQQISEESADQLVTAIEHGGEAQLTIRENSRGRGYKCAFDWRALQGKPSPPKTRAGTFPAAQGSA
jgi:hypothetical protein